MTYLLNKHLIYHPDRKQAKISDRKPYLQALPLPHCLRK